jgi:DNA helicase II / ATP-dependent DNA helicase PcrA
VLARLSRSDPSVPADEAVPDAAQSMGWEPEAVPEGQEEVDRQADLTRLVQLSAESAGVPVGEFLADLKARFASEAGGRGVVLSTYHRAKGLEWEAVFLPRLEERELPFGLARADADVDEERRLLYVGITRARTHLRVSWCATRDGKRVRRSRFVDEILPAPLPRATVRPRADAAVSDPDLFARLRAWRKEVAETTGVPAYVVFHDATLRAICDVQPSSLGELGNIAGIGPAKLAKWGSQVLEVVGG